MKPRLKRDQIWQTTFVHEESARVRHEVDQLTSKQAPAEATNSIYKHSLSLARKQDYYCQLQAVLFALAALRLEAKHPTLSLDSVDHLEKLIKQLLIANQVRPQVSNLSFLYVQLNQALAAIFRARQQPWSASWLEQVARHASAPANVTDPRDAIDLASELLRLGDVATMLSVLAAIPASELSTTAEIDVLKLVLLGRRLSGDLLGALDLNLEMQPRSAGNADLAAHLSFEESCVRVQMGEDVGSLLTLTFGTPQLHKFDYLSEAFLWALTVRSKSGLEKLPGLKRLKLAARTSDNDLQATKTLSCLDTLLSCYDDSKSLSDRLTRLGTMLEDTSKLGNATHELLILGAAARFTHRSRQRRFTTRILARYRAVGLSLSAGMSADPQTTLADIFEQQEQDLFVRPSIVRPPSTALAGRTIAISTMTMELAAALGWQRFQKLFRAGRGRKRLRDDEIQALVAIIAKHVGTLRGPLMKLGQTASYFGLDLPDNAQKILSALQDRAKPLPTENVVQIIEAELRTKLDDVFADFVEEPIGVGSIGQVHRATLNGGEQVVVKVLFPNIRQIIENDIRLVRALLPVLKLFAPAAITLELFDELRLRMLDETNLLVEADHQLKFREKYAAHPHIHVPHVHRDLCTKNLMVSEYFDGVPVVEYCKFAPEAAVAHVGEMITTFVVTNCRDGSFNTDPHPGNILVKENVVCFVDFGSVKDWNAEEAAAWRDVIKAGAMSDYDLFRDAFRRMGVVANPTSFNWKLAFHSFMQGSMGTTATRGFTQFDYETLHREVRLLFTHENPNLAHSYINPTYLYGFRVYFGLIATLSSLNATCDFHAIVARIVNQAGCSPSPG